MKTRPSGELMDLPLETLYSPRLAHFRSVYEHRNLRVTAEILGVSQPALTKSLKILEVQLDVTLFVRSSKGMQPTIAGDILWRHLNQLADISRGLEVELSAQRGSGEGLIRFGAGQMWSRLFIPEIVSEFQLIYPNASLDITTGPMPTLVEELKSGRLDIIVGDFDGIAVSDEYSVELAWCSEFWAFAGTDHELVSKPTVDISDLVKHAWTGYVDGEVFARKVSAFCSEFELGHPKISIRATSLANLLQLTKDSGNIAVLPKELQEEALKSNLIPLQLNNRTLWTINTGSIIETRKKTIDHYQTLLRLIKNAGTEQ